MNTVISASVVLFTLYFLVDFIRYIPNACLAAIVIVHAAIGPTTTGERHEKALPFSN